MSAYLRNVAIGIIFLAVIVTGATSCKKQVAEVRKPDVEPWIVVSVLEWCEGPSVPQGSSLVLFSDHRLIIKRLPLENSLKATSTFWMRVLSQEEFEKIDEAASLVMRTSQQSSSYEFGTYSEYGLTSSLYFGLPRKGVTIDVEGVHLLSLEKDAPADFARLLDYNQLPISLRHYWGVLLEAIKGEFEPWRPTEILIEFFPCRTPEVRCQDWPSDWPQPNFLEGEKAARDEWACVKVGINRLDQVQKLFRGKGQKEFIEMNVAGVKRLVSYQYQYPGEEIWHEFHSPAGRVDIDSFVRPISDLKPTAPRPVPPKNAFELK